MAKYFTDFSEYAVGQQPSDWTEVYRTTFMSWSVVESSDAGVTNGVVLRQKNDAGNQRHGFKWDLIDEDGDRSTVEVVFKARLMTEDRPGEWDLRALVRAKGTDGDETAYVLGRQWLSGTDESRYMIGGYSAGSFILVTEQRPITPPSNGTWYWTRARVSGSSLMVKFWAADSAEPSSWNISGTHSEISSAGWVGLFNALTAVDHDVDCFGVGTGGSPAPMTAEEALPSVHELSGDLAGQGAAIVAEVAAVSPPTEHVLSGALAGAGSAITGELELDRLVIHDLSGNLVGQGSWVTGDVFASEAGASRALILQLLRQGLYTGMA